jgi:hypothetical protein
VIIKLVAPTGMGLELHSLRALPRHPHRRGLDQSLRRQITRRMPRVCWCLIFGQLFSPLCSCSSARAFSSIKSPFRCSFVFFS